MPDLLAVTPLEAAEQLGYADTSSIWILLSKICPTTGEPEIEGLDNQDATGKGNPRRLIKQESIDKFKSSHYRSPGGSWLHSPPKENRKTRTSPTDGSLDSVGIKLLLAEFHAEHEQDHAEDAEELKAADQENAELALRNAELTRQNAELSRDLKLALRELKNYKRSSARSESFVALIALVAQAATSEDVHDALN